MNDVNILFREIATIIRRLLRQDKLLEKRIERIEDFITDSKIGVGMKSADFSPNIGSETGIEDTENYKL